MVSISSVKDKASDTRDQLQQLRAQVEALMSERVTPALADAAGRAESTYRAAADTVTDRADMLSDEVRERPLIAIAIATGLGYLLGRMFR